MKPVLFLHGWAQSRQIWMNQRKMFADAQFLNLPGHGGAEYQPADGWVDAIIKQLPDQPCLLVGWSLGGMLAIKIAARIPERIAALALVSTTPRFRIADDWPHGCADAMFEGFKDAIESDSPKALGRFFNLMLHGDNIRRSDYNRLAKAAVDRKNRASPAGLHHGLKLLNELDLRKQIKKTRQPVLVMHGDADMIVPVEAGKWLAEHLPDARPHIFSSSGHAPFLTRAEMFNQTLHSWRQSL